MSSSSSLQEENENAVATKRAGTRNFTFFMVLKVVWVKTEHKNIATNYFV
jgi:hypothetical protein